MPSKKATTVKPKARPKAKAPVKAKEEKNPFAKYLGRTTNDKDTIIAIFPKTVKRNSQPDSKFVQVRFESGRQTMLAEDELDGIIKKKKR